MNHDGGSPGGIRSLGNISSHRYTISDGLAGMQVEDIYQDRRGLLWIATADGGVSRFDGTHFDTFNQADGLPHPTVMAIAEDEDGRLWFGTLGGGLAVLDEQGFQVYTTEHGLPSDEILGLQPQGDGSLRVLTSAGFGLFLDGRCSAATTDIDGRPIGRVYDMATDVAGTTWLATQDRGVISLDGRELEVNDGVGAVRWAWKLAQDGSGTFVDRLPPQKQSRDRPLRPLSSTARPDRCKYRRRRSGGPSVRGETRARGQPGLGMGRAAPGRVGLRWAGLAFLRPACARCGIQASACYL